MTIADLLEQARAAGVTRVHIQLDLLPLDNASVSLSRDQAPRSDPEPHQPAESNSAPSGSSEDEDPDQQARDLELMHSE